MIRAIVILLVLALLLPLLAFSGIGLYHGYDVPSGLSGAWSGLMKTNQFYSVAENRPDEPASAQWRPVIWRGDLENEWLSEASGLAAAHLTRDTFFSVNDSGHDARLFAVGIDGSHKGSWPLEFSGVHDFEDMAAFQSDGKPYLLIADTGDNYYWRPKKTILIVAEPEIDGATPDRLSPSWMFTFSYPEGYRDSEAVAVDEASGKILLLSKRHIPPELFSLPLKPDAAHVTAKFEGRLIHMPQASLRDIREDPKFGRYRSSPTALAIRGRQAVVLTYRDAYVYKRRLGDEWRDAFAGRPLKIPLPEVFGLESGAISERGNRFVFVGERKYQRARTRMYEVNL